MSWGTLFVGHPLRTSGGITVLLDLTNLSRIELILGHNLLHSLDRNQNVGKDGRKTVTESVEAAASPLAAPRNRLRGV